MNMLAVQQDFQSLAEEYDDFIRRMIPYYEEQNQAILELIPFDKNDAFHAIDLGAGTGALSRLILSHFPNAQVTLLDMTEDMLARGSAALSAYPGRVHTILGDFEGADFAGPYDLAVAGLSIHHLDDAGKAALFHKVAEVLKPGAWFLIRDYVRGNTDALETRYQQAWRNFYQLKDEVEAERFHTHMRNDKPSLLADQLSWLEQAGFELVDCYLKYFAFCVFGGQKAARS